MYETEKTYTASEYAYLENDYTRMSDKYQQEFERRRNWEKKYSDLLTEKRKLEQDIAQLKAQPLRKHNERGAGRKPVATPEQMKEIIQFHKSGLSYCQILKQMNLSWSKGTIRNIILRQKQVKEGAQ